MAGTPEKAAVWANADVLIAPITAVNPGPGEEFSSDWKYAGLLDGDGGFVFSGTRDSTDHFAWGGVLVATTRKNFVQTAKFTVLEKNATVYSILHPGSSFTWTGNDFSGTRNVPDSQYKFKIAFEKRSLPVTERLISVNYAQVDELGDEEETEDSLTMREVTVKIYPSSTGALFLESRIGANPAAASVAVSPATKTLAPAATWQLLVTATYADASTEDVTQVATYTTSAPTKATCDTNGKITAVATGSATITAAFGGQTGTCVVTVS